MKTLLILSLIIISVQIQAQNRCKCECICKQYTLLDSIKNSFRIRDLDKQLKEI